MKILRHILATIALAAFILPASAQTYPSPTYQNLSILGTFTIGGQQFTFPSVSGTLPYAVGLPWISGDCIKASGTAGGLADAGVGCGGGSGGVSSVGLTMPSIFTVGNSPITGSGNIGVTFNTETANLIFAGPASGGAAGPTFRALVAADLPASVPLLSTANTWTNTNNFTGTVQVAGFTMTFPGASSNLAYLVGSVTSGHCLEASGTTGGIADAGVAGCGSGGGGVSSVSVVSANGLAGTVANPTTTPAITLSTTITGALKGNGTAVSQAACADLSNGATGCSTATGTSGATIPLLNGANTWSGVQTVTNSDLAILGSSTGATTFTSANASATNYTLTVPAATDTMALLAATQTLTNKTLTSPTINGAALSGTLSGTPTVSGAWTFTGTPTGSGITALFASPPAIGGTAPSTGAFTTLSSGFLDLNANSTFSGPQSAAVSPLYFASAVGGYVTGNTATPFYFGITDGVNTQPSASNGGFNGMVVIDSVGSTAFGGRVGILGRSQVGAPGGPTRGNYVGLYGQTLISGASNGLAAQGWPNQIAPNDSQTSLAGYQGGAWGGVSYAGMTNSQYYWGTTAHEFDLTYDSSVQQTAIKTGIAIDDLSTTSYFANYENVGLIFGAASTASGGFDKLISVGGVETTSPLASSGTVLAAYRRLYGGTAQPTFLYGIDFRQANIGSGGAAFASPNFIADNTGAVFGNGVTTNSVVQAETATLTSITISVDNHNTSHTGGFYLTVPTITVDAPPSGGTTATVSVATMAGAGVVAFGSTGINFLVNDVVGFTCTSPCAGTIPTIKASAVDTNGGISAFVITAAGSITNPPANPVTLTGGTGTGAMVNIAWSATSGGLYTANTILPASTGGNYQVGDVITPTNGSGDTGTQPSFTVGAVTGTGGILPASLSVTTAGSMTALSTATQPLYRAFTVSPSGGGRLGGSVQTAYGIASLTITNAGTGYLPEPLPTLVTNSLGSAGVTAYTAAHLLAVMTPAAATLNLQPTAGAVEVGAPTGSAPSSGDVDIAGAFKINGVALPSLGTAQTWTAAQTFTNSDLKLLGSSTGATTFSSANASATAYTVTVPAATDTIALLAATQTLTNKSIAGSEINSSLVGATYGGTGVNNGSSTLTLGGSLTTTGAATPTLAFGATGYTFTFPTATTTIAGLGVANTFTAPQSNSPTTLTIATSTFTPNNTSNVYYMTLVHASCPCTLANPSTMPANASLLEIWITQSATGSDTIGTWGSYYKFPGGTKPTLSTTAGAVDMISCRVTTSTTIDCVSAAGTGGGFSWNLPPENDNRQPFRKVG